MIIIAVVAILGAIAWLTFGRRDPSLEDSDRSHAQLDGRSSSTTTATPNLLQAPSVPPSTTTMNPKNLLFSLPTFCDRIPLVESTAIDSTPAGSTVIDEDDWRQVEFAAVRDRAIVDRELAQLARFKVEKRAGAGWTDVFVRQSRPDAIAPLAIPLADLLRSANAKALPLYLRSGGAVSQVVSVRSGPFLTYGGRATQFCGKRSSTRSAEVESSRINTSVKYASGSSSWAMQVATTV